MLVCLPVLGYPGTDEGGKRSSPEPSPASLSAPSVFIMDKGQKGVHRMTGFMLEHNRLLDKGYLEKLITLYIMECQIEGVNHDIALCQMCLETGFLRFDGTVSRFQNNFCGLGAINSTTAGDWFGSMEEGIRAHIQHLKAYASVEPLQSDPVDKRFHHVPRGTVFTLFDLTGRWATDPKYGEKLNWLLKKLYEE